MPQWWITSEAWSAVTDSTPASEVRHRHESTLKYRERRRFTKKMLNRVEKVQNFGTHDSCRRNYFDATNNVRRGVEHATHYAERTC